MLGDYHGLLRGFPCCEALGSFLCQQLSVLVADLLELEASRLIATGGALCRNGYQPEQQLPLACGSLGLRKPRLRGAQARLGGFMRQMRSRKSFHEVPWICLLGLARRELGLLRRVLQAEPALWEVAELRFWQRLEGWRTENLAGLRQHCLVLEGLDFGPDNPQLLVALIIDRQGRSRVIDVRPGDSHSSQQWSDVCASLKQRAIPAPILIKGATETAGHHWPRATALEA